MLHYCIQTIKFFSVIKIGLRFSINQTKKLDNLQCLSMCRQHLLLDGICRLLLQDDFVELIQDNKLITLGRAHATDYRTAAPSSTSLVTKFGKEALAQRAPFARHHSATAVRVGIALGCFGINSCAGRMITCLVVTLPA